MILKFVIGFIVIENQSGFVHGRHIGDGIITAVESVSWLKRK